MGMTIEQDIKVIRKMLACTDLRTRENLHADMIDACEDAIATMRKYQKIEEIMNELNGDFYGSYLMDRQTLEKIYEVLEDGNDN